MNSESSSDVTSTEPTQKENNNSGGESAANRKCCVPTVFRVRDESEQLDRVHFCTSAVTQQETQNTRLNVKTFTCLLLTAESRLLFSLQTWTHRRTHRAVCHSESSDAKLTSFQFQDKETNVRKSQSNICSSDGRTETKTFLSRN